MIKNFLAVDNFITQYQIKQVLDFFSNSLYSFPDPSSGQIGKVFVAGGCLRDIFMGKDFDEINDIDIFVNMHNAVAAEQLVTGIRNTKQHLNMSSTTGWKFNIGDYGNHLYTITFPAYISNATVGINKPIQLIFTACQNGNYESNPIYKFDYGLNMISYDGKTVSTSNAFIDDVINKTMTCYTIGEIQDLEHHFNRMYNLHNKFPDHKIVMNIETIMRG